MKKYFFSVIFIFTVLSLSAQIKGDVSVTRRVLCERDGMLVMELDIRAGAKAVTRSQSWTIIPELSTPDRKSVKLFPHVEVRGAYQRHMAQRRQLLTGEYWVERQPYAVIDVDGKTDQSVSYQMSVPYEAWMQGASLVVRQTLNSPGGVRRIFTIDINGAVDTGRK